MHVSREADLLWVHWKHISLPLSFWITLLFHFYCDPHFFSRPRMYRVLTTHFMSGTHNLKSTFNCVFNSVKHCSSKRNPSPFLLGLYNWNCSKCGVFVCNDLLWSGSTVLLLIKSLKCWCKLRGRSWISTKDPRDYLPFQTSKECMDINLNNVFVFAAVYWLKQFANQFALVYFLPF